MVAKEVGVYLEVAYEEGAATGVHSLYASRFFPLIVVIVMGIIVGVILTLPLSLPFLFLSLRRRRRE